jgi:hypothetical protein
VNIAEATYEIAITTCRKVELYMPERLTWEQIVDRYPNQWVALTDVEYLNNDKINVESGIVVANMTDDEYIDKRVSFIKQGLYYSYWRTSDIAHFVGVTV